VPSIDPATPAKATAPIEPALHASPAALLHPLLYPLPVAASPALNRPIQAQIIDEKNKCRALVLHSGQNKRKRRSETERLRDDWRSLWYFKRMHYEPVLDDFGSQKTGEGLRRSRRIQQHLLLTA